MEIEIDVSGYRPDVAATNNQIAISCEIVKFESGRPMQSGKTIRLGMTAEDAMRLLTLLKSAQQQFGWPDHFGYPLAIEVPPDRQKN